MKEFAVYTMLRLLMLAATFGIILGIWLMVDDEVNIFLVVVLAFIISGVGSYFLLNNQREAFARRVQARASRASAAFEQMKAKEDLD